MILYEVLSLRVNSMCLFNTLI